MYQNQFIAPVHDRAVREHHVPPCCLWLHSENALRIIAVFDDSVAPPQLVIDSQTGLPNRVQQRRRRKSSTSRHSEQHRRTANISSHAASNHSTQWIAINRFEDD